MSEQSRGNWVVQFSTLEELVEEIGQLPFPPAPIVRVDTLEFSAVFNKKIGLDSRVIGVQARVIDHVQNTVLCCYLPARSYERLGGRPFGPENERHQKEGWEEARALRERVAAYISEHAGRLVHVRAGIIEIDDDIRIQLADWPGDPAQETAETAA